VQPKSSFAVVTSDGEPIENARITLATYRWPFPRPATTVLTTFRTDEEGELHLRSRRRWHWQIALPDAWTAYTWGYCVEKAGFRAVASPEIDKRIGAVTVTLEAASTLSVCAWPEDDGQAYWQVAVEE
jgi:hypothetical protein